MFRMHHMLINRPVAKQIWTAVGSAAQDLENPPAPYEVAASDRGGKPLRATVGHREFSRFVSRDLERLLHFVDSCCTTIPSIYLKQIFRRGIFFTGEGATLRGIAKHYETSLGIPCHSMCEYHA